MQNKTFVFLLFIFMWASACLSQNPIINTQYTADPTARVFNGKLYLYPSHDIPCQKGQGYIGFCMADYHVFSTDNLVDWQDHGVVLTQEEVPWAATASFSMWAPDCVYKNGTYYFYFPVIEKDSAVTRARRIGVATSTSPSGTFKPEKNYIANIRGIDPNILIDNDGQAYLYWANKKQIFVAKLKENMLELATEPQLIETPTEKFKEGPFVFERNNLYYLTYPFVNKNTEQLVYGIGKHPMGPFEYKGLIMKESVLGCWTNHQSMVNFKDQWYLFYHNNYYSPKFDKNRSVHVDSLFFEADGSIREVIPTFRGVGITKAKSAIHIDRYSSKSDKGISLAYIDSLDYFKGWKTKFNSPDSWVSYSNVAFDKTKLKKLITKVYAPQGGSFEIRLNSLQGDILAQGDFEKSGVWSSKSFRLKKVKPGKHKLYFISNSAVQYEIDYIQFQ